MLRSAADDCGMLRFAAGDPIYWIHYHALITFRRLIARRSMWETLSRLIGWAYTFLWSASFYPQLIVNYRLKQVRGLSKDFVSINPIGFILYTVSLTGLLFSNSIREEYHERYGGHPQVQMNDWAFGFHASLLSIAILSQTLYYSSLKEFYQITWPSRLLLATGILALATFLIRPSLNVLYALQWIKICISTYKLIPQALLNFRRKSTVGWSIENILLDFSGGMLSLVQLVIDSFVSGDNWSGVFASPGKVGLSLLAISFNILFMTQHYILYKNRSLDPDPEEPDISESTPLLA